MDNILTCKYEKCNKFFVRPIRLPCDKSICEEHVKEISNLAFGHFYCQFCSQEHEIPNNGFRINQDLQNALNSNLHLRKNHRKAVDTFRKLESIVKESNNIKNDPEGYINTYFTDIKNKIDLQKERLKLKIDLISQELINQVETLENKCETNLRALKKDNLLDSKATDDDSDDDVNLKKEIESWSNALRTPKLDKAKLSEIMNDLEKNLKNYKIKIKNYKNALFCNVNEIEFTPNFAEFNKDLFGKFNIKCSFLNEKELLMSFGEHKESVRCLEVKENAESKILTLLSGSDDKTIKIWDGESGVCQRTLKGHSNKVMCLKLILENKLVSGSADCSIKIWDLNNFECIGTLNGHKNIIWCLSAGKESENLFSGSGDFSIKVWNLNKLKCIKTLAGHRDAVRCLLIASNGNLISGSFDTTIRLWNLESYKCISTLSGHQSSIVCLDQMSNGCLISASFDGKIKLWNIETKTCINTLDNNYAINSLKILPTEEYLIISDSSIYQNLKVWSLESKTCSKKFHAHSSIVNDFKLINNGCRLITASNDGTIKMWDV